MGKSKFPTDRHTDTQTHTQTDSLLYITRISGRFVPFILVGSPLRLGPGALGMDRVEQVVVGTQKKGTQLFWVEQSFFFVNTKL